MPTKEETIAQTQKALYDALTELLPIINQQGHQPNTIVMHPQLAQELGLVSPSPVYIEPSHVYAPADNTAMKIMAMGPDEFAKWLDEVKKEEEIRNSPYKRFAHL